MPPKGKWALFGATAGFIKRWPDAGHGRRRDGDHARSREPSVQVQLMTLRLHLALTGVSAALRKTDSQRGAGLSRIIYFGVDPVRFS